LVQNQKSGCKGEFIFHRLWAGTVQELLKEEKQNKLGEEGKDEVVT